MIDLKLRRLHPAAKLPTLRSEGGVTYNLYAYSLTDSERPNKIMIPQRNTRPIPTGISIEPPPGYYIMICSSGGPARDSLFVTNAPGVIKPDYRGEINVLLYNGGIETQWVQHEDCVAQFIVMPITESRIVEVKSAN